MNNLYIDMDGVLADFNAEPDGVKRFQTEKGFFKKLKPLEKNVNAVKKALADGKNLFILSASPNENADKDKIKWLKKYIPQLKSNKIILCRNGQNKKDFIKTPDGILFDDYGKNCRDWAADGNLSFKVKADGDLEKLFRLVK